MFIMSQTLAQLSTILGFMKWISPTGIPAVPPICHICLAAQPGLPKSTPPIASLLPMLQNIIIFLILAVHTVVKPALPSQPAASLTLASMADLPLQAPSGESNSRQSY